MNPKDDRHPAEVREVNVERTIQNDLRESISKVVSDLSMQVKEWAERHQWSAQSIDDSAVDIRFMTIVPVGHTTVEGGAIDSMGMKISFTTEIDLKSERLKIIKKQLREFIANNQRNIVAADAFLRHYKGRAADNDPQLLAVGVLRAKSVKWEREYSDILALLDEEGADFVDMMRRVQKIVHEMDATKPNLMKLLNDEQRQALSDDEEMFFYME